MQTVSGTSEWKTLFSPKPPNRIGKKSAIKINIQRRVLPNSASASFMLIAYLTATTNAVTTIFAIASGSRNFQPKAISWS